MLALNKFSHYTSPTFPINRKSAVCTIPHFCCRDQLTTTMHPGCHGIMTISTLIPIRSCIVLWLYCILLFQRTPFLPFPFIRISAEIVWHRFTKTVFRIKSALIAIIWHRHINLNHLIHRPSLTSTNALAKSSIN